MIGGAVALWPQEMLYLDLLQFYGTKLVIDI